jgi:DNA polymerase I-like protein with 3'-5' exonuclease and polymerase domains
LRAEAERQSINAPVQGFIGDYKSMIMVELAQAFPETHLRIKMEHHDAIIGWIKDEYLDEVCPEIYERANNPRLARECGLEFPIPFPVDLELGRWGAAKKWRSPSAKKTVQQSPTRAGPTRLPRRVLRRRASS